MRKRDYGTGNATDLKNGKWQLKYRPEWSPKPCYRTEKGGSTASEKKRIGKVLSDWVTELDKLSSPPVALSIETLHDLLKRDYTLHGRSSTEDTSTKFKKHLGKYFAGTDLVALKKSEVEQYMEERVSQGAANATVNREVSWLHRAMNLAIDKELTSSAFRWERLPEDAGIRHNFISLEEYRAIMQELPQHLKMLWCFSYYWGIRKGELLKIRWEWVLPYLSDPKPCFKIPGFHKKERVTKSGKPHTLPLYMPEMVEFLKLALSTRNPKCPYVFQFRDKQLKSPRTGFENARKAAGLEHIIMHDLRRTAVRNMMRSGMTKKRAMQISGHLTERDRKSVV